MSRTYFLSTIIVMLMICLSTVHTGVNAQEPTGPQMTIYVDDDNMDPPWDGTPENPYPYIQTAIDYAAPGDTVSVANGTYYESLYISKEKLTIDRWIHPDLDTGLPTLLGYGNGTGIWIEAPEVRISNLNITNFGQWEHDAGMYISETIEACEIFGCEIANCENGIWIQRLIPTETHHRIENNTIHDIHRQGIAVQLCNSNIIMKNSVSNCNHGITFFDCDYNTIEENSCINNSVGIFLSNQIRYISQKTMILNDFKKRFVPLDTTNISSHSSTQHESSDILHQGSSENSIRRNVCNGNQIDGIALKGIKTGNRNYIEKNICFNNYKGIAVRDSEDVTVQENWCEYNEQGILINNADANVGGNNCSHNKIGIYLYGTSGEKSSGNITENVCNNNSLGGIVLFNCTRSSILDNQIEYCWNGIWIERSFYNIIQNNDIINNNGIGVILTLTIGNRIKNNNIYKNTLYDIAGILGFANARLNYWGGGLPNKLVLGWVRIWPTLKNPVVFP